MRNASRQGTLTSRQASGRLYFGTKEGQEITACTSAIAASTRGTLASASAMARATNGSTGIRNRVPMLLK